MVNMLHPVPEHGAVYISEHGNTAARAYFSPSNYGVSFWLKGQGRSSNDYATFGIGIEDAAELSRYTDTAADNVPALEELEAQHELRRQKFAIEHPDIPYTIGGPKAPVVHSVDETGENRWEFRGGDLATKDLVLGGLVWAREQLIVRINEVDTLVFRPDAFRLFGVIAGNRPAELDKKPASIWDRTVQK